MEIWQHPTQRKVRARLRMARDRIARADYRSAIVFLQSALKRLEREPASLVDRALCYIELARCLNLQGEPGQAAVYARWALNLLRSAWEVEIPEAEARLELGRALVRTGDLQEAQQLLSRAYRTFVQHENWAQAAICLENVGILAKRQEHLVRAINAFHFAKQLYHQIEDIEGLRRAELQLRDLIPQE
jgi:tetratricopeptide (TPR) repeat protein